MTRDLLTEVTVTLRMMAKNPGFTIVVVLTLTVGIGANTAMFGVLDRVLLRPLPYPDPDRLVLGRSTFTNGSLSSMSAPDYRDFQERSQALEPVAAIRSWTSEGTVTWDREPERIAAVPVTPNLFATLGVRPYLGRFFEDRSNRAVQAGGDAASSGEGEPEELVAVISHRCWQRYLGGLADAIGKVLVVDGNAIEVIGVMPPGFHFLHDVDLWVPWTLDSHSRMARRYQNWFLLGRLKPGVTRAEAQAEADVIARQLQEAYPEINQGRGVRLDDLHSTVVSDARPGLLLLMTAVGLVLLIACANIAGLLLARGSQRRRELAMRASLGASRLRLVRQLLTESLTIATVAAVPGVLLTLWLQQLLLQVFPLQGIGISEIPINSSVLGFAAAICVATALLFGLAPALRGANVQPVRDLKVGGRATDAGTGSLLRQALVAGQITVSVVLLVGAGLLLRSLHHLWSSDLGFDPQGLLTAKVELPFPKYQETEQRIAFYTALQDDVRGLPGVTAVGMISLLPVREPRNTTGVWAAERPPGPADDRTGAFIRRVLPGYFEAMGIPLLAGRATDSSDRSQEGMVVVLNQDLAGRLFPQQDAVGRRVAVDLFTDEPATARVIGVVGDVRVAGLDSDPPPVIYLSSLQGAEYSMQLAVRTAGDPTGVINPLRAVVSRLDPGIAVGEPRSMETVLTGSIANRRVVTALLAVFALVAVGLAAIGLYGVLSYYVGQYRHEIGVRMALGATGSQVLALVLRRGARLVVAGLLTGTVASLVASRALQHLLFGVPANDHISIIGANLLFTVVATLACLIPSWRAARINPITSLQSE